MLGIYSPFITCIIYGKVFNYNLYDILGVFSKVHSLNDIGSGEHQIKQKLHTSQPWNFAGCLVDVFWQSKLNTMLMVIFCSDILHGLNVNIIGYYTFPITDFWGAKSHLLPNNLKLHIKAVSCITNYMVKKFTSCSEFVPNGISY